MDEPTGQTLEHQLDQALLELQTATTPAARRLAYKRMLDLKARRSPERVAQLEDASMRRVLHGG
jgi:hypothetical protein